MRFRKILLSAVSLLLALAVLAGWGLSARAQSHPCDSPSVMPRGVCGFDAFHGNPPRQIPNGWTEYILSGDLTFMQDVDTYWGAPALRM